MATLLNTTLWTHTATAGTTKTVTIPAATAGSTLIVCAGGGAIITATGFTKRSTYGGGGQDVSVSDMVAVGGETSVELSLNGAENISGIIYELAGLGGFVGWSNNGGGAIPNLTGNYELAPTTSVTAAAPSLAVALWSINAPSSTRPSNGLNRFRQMGPLGYLHAHGANQPGSGSEFVWASGLADVTATGRYPLALTAGEYRATSQWVNPSGDTTGFVVQALYADPSGVPTNPAVNQVARENSLPGTDSSYWFGGEDATNPTIAGYCDSQSYQPGDTVEFRVDSTGNPFRVEVYRLGYYGWETMGARRVTEHITGAVTTQPTPTVDPILGSTSCAWTTNATWQIPADACPGVYAVLFRRTDTTTNFASSHFVVRGDTTGKTTIVIPDLTYQAYNAWGATTDTGTFSAGSVSGRSLYRHGADGATDNFGHRAYAVSFDRPYHTQAGNPNTYLWDADHGFIHFAEAQGYDLTYLSDTDLDRDPTLLVDASLVALIGHSEYWTAGVYDAYENAVDAGVNMFIYGSNLALWHVRFDPADTGRRTVICYKESGTRDVSAGWTGTGYDPSPEWTGTWRDTQPADTKTNSDVRRENALTGQLFLVNGAVVERLTVPAASKTLPIWRNSPTIQALTDGQAYSTVATTMGYELDIADGSEGQPETLIQLNPTSMDFPGRGANPAGTIYTGNTGLVNVGFSLYRRASGALVFNTGSWRAWWGTTRWYASDLPDVGRAVDVDWQNALLAILHDLGATPPAPREMKPGLDPALTDPATGAPDGDRNSIARAYGLTVPTTSSAFLLYFG